MAPPLVMACGYPAKSRQSHEIRPQSSGLTLLELHIDRTSVHLFHGSATQAVQNSHELGCLQRLVPDQEFFGTLSLLHSVFIRCTSVAHPLRIRCSSVVHPFRVI